MRHMYNVDYPISANVCPADAKCQANHQLDAVNVKKKRLMYMTEQLKLHVWDFLIRNIMGEYFQRIVSSQIRFKQQQA